MHLVADQARQTRFYNLHGTRYHFLVTSFDQRHLLYISMIELLTKLDVIYKTKFGDENVSLDEFLELEKKFENNWNC